MAISFGILSKQLRAQGSEIKDSLLLEARSAYSIDLKANLYLDLAHHHNQPAQALDFALVALQLSQSIENDTLIAAAYELIGVNNRILGNIGESVLATDLALFYYTKLGFHIELALMHLHLGDVTSQSGNFVDAVKLYQQSIRLLDSLGEKQDAIAARINLSESYLKIDSLKAAASVLEMALKMLDENRFDIKYYSLLSAYAKGNLGMVYHEQDSLNEAIVRLDSAVSILDELEDHYALVTYETEIGQIQIKQGRVGAGFQQIERALARAQEHQLKEQVRDISESLSNLYAYREDYGKAYFYGQLHQVYKDSIVNPDNIRTIEQTLAQYEIDQKESERLQAEQERNYVLIIGGLAIVLALIILWAYIQKQRTNRALLQKNEIISKQAHEKELLHREMHHRVKNNLQLISSIMGLQARSEKDEAVNQALSSGRSRMEAMTLIHQSLYQQGQQAHVEMQDYIQRLTGYLMTSYLEELKTIQLDVTHVVLKADDSIPIGLIVNEAICNAVKYGTGKKLTLKVTFEAMDKGFMLPIKDDGPGFDQSWQDPIPKDIEDAASTGFGTQLIQTLARQMRGEVDIQSSENGTTIRLYLPYLREVIQDKQQVTA